MLTRRKASLQQALDHQKRYIREALGNGMPPKQVAWLSGLTEGRTSQIRNEGSPPVTVFDLM